MIRNALSVDVEDWFQVGAFETVIRKEDWSHYPVRVEANTAAVLQLFADSDVKATFFTLGQSGISREPTLRGSSSLTVAEALRCSSSTPLPASCVRGVCVCCGYEDRIHFGRILEEL